MNKSLCWDCENTDAYRCPRFNPDCPATPIHTATETIYRKQGGKLVPLAIVTACKNFKKEI